MEDDLKKLPRSWLERLSDLLIREPKDRKQLMEVLRNASERDILSTDMLHMIESVLQVSEMHVRDIMISKNQMIVIESNHDLATLLPVVIESGHSRFPIIDSSSNEVTGILLAKDLIKYCLNNSDHPFEMQKMIRPAVFVPQSKRLDVLLREFRINHHHMAIVIDEYGHVAGLVTIEDVLEQIVGDIEDEYDTEEDDEIKKQSDGSYLVKATTPIDDFNEYFDSKLNAEEFDTIGGLILQGFGHLPKRGEILKIENFHFKILHSDKRRIHLLETTRE
ncbi:MAG: corC [Gammaproteobacteria bacterium]|jgi:magnesium and cobalt transporter|nr:corC [Gammaproteobacteria bacterium]